MNAVQPVRVVLEIERQQSTISGQLAVNGAPARGFFGWLELIDRLERAIASSGTQSDGAADRTLEA